MRTLLLAATVTGLVGCVGQLDTGSGTVGPGTNPNPTGANSMAKMMFDSDVYPIIANGEGGAAAQCSSCHSASGPVGNVTGFVAGDAADGYATATSYQSLVGNFTPAAAGIMTQVANGHNARMYTADQQSKITAWLAQEVTERGAGTATTTGGMDPEQVTASLLNNWSACMSLTNFQTAKMTDWAVMQANNGSDCQTCHATGQSGMIASEVDTVFFDTISSNQYYLITYFTVDLTMGIANAKVIPNTSSFMGVSQGQAPHVEHPEFNATTNQGMTALQTFYTSTMTAVAAGNCGATKLNPPMQ